MASISLEYTTELLATDQEKIRALSRENADLRLQLEQRVKLREDLKRTLDRFSVAFDEVREYHLPMTDFLVAVNMLDEVYRAAKEAGAV